MESYDTYLFLAELRCFPVQCLEECWHEDVMQKWAPSNQLARNLSASTWH